MKKKAVEKPKVNNKDITDDAKIRLHLKNFYGKFIQYHISQ